MQTKKRVLWIALILVSGFVLADYLEFFPTLYKDYAMVLPFTFEFIDAENGNPVSGVVVDASYKGINAIGQLHDYGDNTIYILVRGGGFGYKQTFLFKKPPPRQTIKRINNKEIDFAFHHPDYQTVEKTLTKNKAGQAYVIKLMPAQASHAQEQYHLSE